MVSLHAFCMGYEVLGCNISQYNVAILLVITHILHTDSGLPKWQLSVKLFTTCTSLKLHYNDVTMVILVWYHYYNIMYSNAVYYIKCINYINKQLNLNTILYIMIYVYLYNHMDFIIILIINYNTHRRKISFVNLTTLFNISNIFC